MIVEIHAFAMYAVRAAEGTEGPPLIADAVAVATRPLPRVVAFDDVALLLNLLGDADPRRDIVPVGLFGGAWNAHLLHDGLRACSASGPCWVGAAGPDLRRELHVRSPHWRLVAMSLNPDCHDAHTARMVLP
jgi:hypothetical protein